MMWLRTLFGARWLPVAVVGITGVMSIVGLWAYMKGYSNAEEHYLKQMNRVVQLQLKAQEKQFRKRLMLAVKEAEKTATIRRNISDIEVHTNCRIAAECLQSFNDAVRAADTNPIRTD